MVTDDVSLAEELVLLAYNSHGNACLDGTRLSYGVGGALLLELTLAGRVGVVDNRVAVADPTPLGHPLLDAALHRIRTDRRALRPKKWVARLGSRRRVLDRLVRTRVLRREEHRVLFVFPHTRYPSSTGVTPAAETDARRRLRAAVTATGPVEPRTAALCALVAAVGLDRKLFADLPRARVRARLREIGRGAWAAEAVRKVIDDMQAAAVAAAAAGAAATMS
jgi:hypothetical protein